MNRLVILILGCAVLAARAQDVSSELSSARALNCTFGAGTRTAWVAGQPRTSEARLDKDILFDSIDIAAGTARVLADVRIDQAHVAFSPVGLFVVDARPGEIDITTIFASGAREGIFPAVDVRQMNASGPSSEQYFGTCKLRS